MSDTQREPKRRKTAADMEVVIHPQGDVILKCGSAATGTLRQASSPIAWAYRIADNMSYRNTKVSSQVLSVVSPVFQAMLAPHFNEGSRLASAGKVEIPLPDDDPEAMTLVCEIVHMKGNIPLELNAQRIQAIAKLCDK